jgi:hypothetical protein
MKPIELMAIEQAREWGVCTLNEFRQFLGLKKFESFEEWCSVGDVAVSRLLSVHIPRSFEWPDVPSLVNAGLVILIVRTANRSEALWAY